MDPRISYRMAAKLTAGLILFVAVGFGVTELTKRSRQAEAREYILSALPEGFKDESTFTADGLERLFGEHPCGLGHAGNLRYLVRAGVSTELGVDEVTLEAVEKTYGKQCDTWTSKTRDRLNSVDSNTLSEQAQKPSSEWNDSTIELFKLYDQLKKVDRVEAAALETYTGFAALESRKGDEGRIQTVIDNYRGWKNKKHRVTPLFEALQRTGAIASDEIYVGLMQSLQSSMKGLETCRGDHPQGARAQSCGRELDGNMNMYFNRLNDMRRATGGNTFDDSTFSFRRTRSDFTQATLTVETLYQ